MSQTSRSQRSKAKASKWEQCSREELLDVRICDLGLEIPGTWLEEMIEKIYRELERRRLRVRPHFWLSDEWFCPKGVPGVAIPFFLAHPKLKRLEQQQMLEVEGGARPKCLKLLRHEVGHAVIHAYDLHRRKDWQKVFGRSSQPYPQAYLPDPHTKKFVQHLDDWYAQSHPEEDFAETFAVWLKPGSNWRRRYADWPALKKLEFVDRLMAEIGPTKPKVRCRAQPDSLSRQRQTLRNYYEEKRSRYSVGFVDLFDRDLMRLFKLPEEAEEIGQANGNGNGQSAAQFLRRHQREIRQLVARWTGEFQYTLDEVLKEMRGRCRELGLRAVTDERQLVLDFSILLTVHTMHHIFVRREWRIM